MKNLRHTKCNLELTSFKAACIFEITYNSIVLSVFVHRMKDYLFVGGRPLNGLKYLFLD